MGSVFVGWRNLKTDLPPQPQKIFSELKNMKRGSEFSYHLPEHLKRRLQAPPGAPNPNSAPSAEGSSSHLQPAGTEGQALPLQRSYKPSNKARTTARKFKPRVETVPAVPIAAHACSEGAEGPMAGSRAEQDPGLGGSQQPDSQRLLHPKDTQMNTGFPVSAASNIHIGEGKTIPGEHQIHRNAARKPKVAATEAHTLTNKPQGCSQAALRPARACVWNCPDPRAGPCAWPC